MRTSLGVTLAMLARWNERLASHYNLNTDAMRAWVGFVIGAVIFLLGAASGVGPLSTVVTGLGLVVACLAVML